ncbi:hypothetical protein Q8A73_020040 [Channa argus]|nr:hypothetical protein Q8A73_020040 [Channa argus]
MKKVKKTIQEMKDSYERNRKEYEKSVNLLESLKQESRNLEEQKTKLLDQSYNHIVQLEQVALNGYSLSTLVHLDVLSKKMMEKGEREKAHKLNEMKDQAHKGSRAGLRYIKAAPSGWEQK